MASAGQIARRAFLIGTAAVAGGLAVGWYQYRKPGANPLVQDGSADGPAALTPYVRIDQNGVSVIAPRAEMGQGVHSTLAALVAEELDLAWQDVRVEHGPPDPVYYNGVAMGEALPFASTDTGRVAGGARAFGDVLGKFLGLQVTGGSSTVPDAFEKMRAAGAAARHVLIAAAAESAGLAIAQLETDGGAVVLPDGRRLEYASLARVAAGIELPADIPLRPTSEWRLLGRSLPRLDMAAKCTGTEVFGIDMDLPGMVHATVRANPGLGGAVIGYDASGAEAARGVLKVVPVPGGAAVVADSTWRAFAAAELIEFDWGPALYPASSQAMFDEIAASFVPDRQDSRFKDDGDAEAALDGAQAIEAEYRVPFLAHAPMEPLNATARLKDGRLDIWTGTQIPMQVVKSAAELTGLDEADIHVHVLPMGGSFGRRLEDDFIRQAVVIAQAVEGVPVRMTWTREEDMRHDFCRPAAIARMRGAVAQGGVDALDISIACPSVSASQTGRLGISLPGPDTMIVAGAWDQPLSIPNYRVTGYRAPEMVPVSSWRSVGASGNGFFHEGFLDEVIRAGGLDPMEERIRLAWHEPSRKVLEAVAEMSDWGGDPGGGRGRGVAFTLSFGVPAAQVIEVSNTRSGIRIDRVFAAVDVGTALDPQNIEAQVSGGIIFGLSAAVMGEITYEDGAAEQDNFHAYDGLRINQVPEIKVRVLENQQSIRGCGEPGVPPAAPALANAIFDATGQRIRELPLQNHVDFL